MSANQVSASHQNPSSLDAAEDQCRDTQRLTEHGVGESSNSLDTLTGGPDQQQLSAATTGNQIFGQRRASLQSLTGSSTSSIGVERELQSLSSSSLSASSVSDSDDEDKRTASKQPAVDQSELRKQILKIQSDSTIPASDKAKRIQVLAIT